MSNDKKKNRANNFKIPIKKPTRKEFVTTLVKNQCWPKQSANRKEVRK